MRVSSNQPSASRGVRKSRGVERWNLARRAKSQGLGTNASIYWGARRIPLPVDARSDKSLRGSGPMPPFTEGLGVYLSLSTLRALLPLPKDIFWGKQNRLFFVPQRGRIGAFCSVFQTVQDSPTESEELCNPSHQFSKFRQNFAKFCKFSFNSAFFQCNFHRFSPEFHGTLGNCLKSLNFDDFPEIS